LTITKIKDRRARGGRLRGGADFRYKYSGNNGELREYLKGLEIGVHNKPYSCFLYALKILNITDDETINKINSGRFTRYLAAAQACSICDEFELDVGLIFHSRKSNTIIRKGEHSISIWNNHYFINELTPFLHS
jgi:hypothetical protein